MLPKVQKSSYSFISTTNHNTDRSIQIYNRTDSGSTKNKMLLNIFILKGTIISRHNEIYSIIACVESKIESILIFSSFV